MTDLRPPENPRDYDECAACGAARWTHGDTTTAGLCTEFVELSQPTRMARVMEAAGALAVEFATFRASLQSTLRAVAALHGAMQTAGLLPEDEQPDTHTEHGRHHADIEDARQAAVEQLSAALDVPQALITGPSPDGLPDSWVTVAGEITHGWRRPADECTAQTYVHPAHDMPQPAGPAIHCPGLGPAETAQYWVHLAGRAAGKTSSMADSCPTCWPRPCDPTRSMCRRNPDTTQAMPAVTDGAAEPDTPHLCDGCGCTDRPVTATDDGRALACPDCLPAANANIAADHEHGPDCVRHGCPCPTAPPIPDPPTYISPFRTPNDPPHTHQPGCRHHQPAPEPERDEIAHKAEPERSGPPA